MSTSLLATTVSALSQAAEEAAGDPPIPAFAVGGIALAILLLLMIGLVVFGGGREHS